MDERYNATEAEDKILSEVVNKLNEHFDSVRIFVTRRDGGQEETLGISRGGGNFYAQIGQVKEWLIREDQTVRETMKQKPEA